MGQEPFTGVTLGVSGGGVGLGGGVRCTPYGVFDGGIRKS